MNAAERRRVSKTMSFGLRHDPAALGLVLEEGGWVQVPQLLAGLAARGLAVTRAQLEEVVTTNDKQRFELSDDGTRIRARQGHSVEVDLDYAPAVPPEVLFHGTHPAALPAIRAEGLRKMERHHVHLSPDARTARQVGGRRGPPVLLEVEAGRLARDGAVFYRTGNDVWLVDHVPAPFLRFVD